MSKSRLEKFLYALYSLDSSDLPTPLSRIEELYKCWVTGEEVSTFEPLSRVEKYLMAILGVYDVELLPNPLSRVEVLLHKLATGDDNLDDVKSFLSEHEELLAEIIRNGGVGGDIEYVLYTLSTEHSTLYNTSEKPVKNAILKGNTLVNLVGEKRFYTNNGTSTILKGWEFMLPYNLTKGKTYLAVFNATGSISSTNSKVYLMDNDFGSNTGNTANPAIFEAGYNMVKCVASGDNHRVLRIRTQVESSGEFKVSDAMLIEYQDGMENWDIPYFEGMKSVQMPVLTTTGKNNFNINGEFIMTGATYSINGDSLIVTGDWFIRRVIDLKPNTTYTLSYENAESDNGFTKMAIYYNGTSEMIDSTFSNKVTFTTPSSFKDICVIFYAEEGGSVNTVTYTNIQIEESSVATEYEPYKSNILTVNEEVELRKINDVQDELNLITGELTERIGEVVLDGSEVWGLASTKEKTQVFEVGLSVNQKLNDAKPSGLLMCDKFKVASGVDDEIIALTTCIYLGVLKSKASTVAELKVYLSQNPITIQYQTKKESVKTVDLSVVNQDGNDTKLSTFNDITYVTLSSEGPIPEAELEVATKNEEVLNTMSLEMDDISTTQNSLQETSNTQSENVDSTMIATTEIYEGLL